MTVVHPVQPSPSIDADRLAAPITLDGERRKLNVRFGVGDGNDVALGHAHRPAWRGRIHVIGLVAAVPAVGALLLSSTGDARFRIALGVYAVGLCSRFGASATSHRWVHGLKARSA
ncbi:MAG TPA: hypothetical protein VLN74_04195, partial [Ilumatobacteraceae bacterium]|nr:hypothetical protein [Ilumatobacteraceae bacterium]